MNKIKQKILNRIKKTSNNCWLWQGATNPAGYGKTYIGKINGKDTTKDVHRLMYEFAYGEIPNGKNVCHKCDNTSCCNPEHLYLATQKQNLADMTQKGRRANGKSLSEKIKKGWTPDTRKKHSKIIKQARWKKHCKEADITGVPHNWKKCPSCNCWMPPSAFYKASKRPPLFLKPYCKWCQNNFSQ